MFRIGTRILGKGRYWVDGVGREVGFIGFLKLVFYQKSCFMFFVGVEFYFSVIFGGGISSLSVTNNLIDSKFLLLISKLQYSSNPQSVLLIYTSV